MSRTISSNANPNPTPITMNLRRACLACILSVVAVCLISCGAIPPGASFRVPLPKQAGTIQWESYEGLFPTGGK